MSEPHAPVERTKAAAATAQSVLEAIGDPSFIVDEETAIGELNQAAASLLDADRSTLLGTRLIERLLLDGSRERLRKVCSGDLAQRVVVPVTVVRSDGTRLDEDAVISQFSRTPEARGFLVMMRATAEESESQAQESSDALSTFGGELSLDPLDDDEEPHVGSIPQALGEVLEELCHRYDWLIGHALVRDVSDDTFVSGQRWAGRLDARTDTFRTGTQDVRFSGGRKGWVTRIGQLRRPAALSNVPQQIDRERSPRAREAGLQFGIVLPIFVGEEMTALLEFYDRAPLPNVEAFQQDLRNAALRLAQFFEKDLWRQERAYLAAIVDSSYDAIIGKNRIGRILSWNRGAERVYGYKAEEAIGQDVSIILPHGQTKEEKEILEAVRRGRRLDGFEVMRRRKGGRRIPVAVTVSPIRAADGRIIGASSIERDITARLRREREVREAKDAAEAANIAKGEFLANISHELRTPMNAIIGMLQLALGDELNATVRDYLQTANDSAHTLLYLLNDLLDFSRMEAGKFSLELHPFQLTSAIEKTIRTLSLRAHEKGLELVYHVDSNVPPTLLGDGRRLRQILMNLVGNAIKFTDRGQVSVSASVHSRRGENIDLLIAVRDTGIGISQTDQQRIFAPFTQADASMTRRHSGTGLGLSICRELVRKMDGHIWVESEQGVGTTFFFTARLKQASLPDVLHGTGLEPDALTGRRVILIDNDEEHREAISEALLQWHMSPIALSEFGPASREHLVNLLCDADGRSIVIVDNSLPKKGGAKFIQWLRSVGGSNFDAILTTAPGAAAPTADELEEARIHTLLTKPVNADQLLASVTQIVAGESAHGSYQQKDDRTDQPLRVLLAEDTPANQKVVRAILERRGHHVDVAFDGREALELHGRAPYDVVLMDIQMPVMGGYKATAEIRSWSGPAATVPIIALTAHAMPDDRQESLESGMDSYLSKPLDARKLITTVERYGRRSEGRSANVNDSRAELDVQHFPDEPPFGTAPLNLSAAAERMGGDWNLVREMAAFFKADAPQLCDIYQSELEAGNFPEVERAAHSLKGLASNFDAHSLIELALAGEQAARQQREGELRELLPKLRTAVDELSAQLEGYPYPVA